MCVGGGEEVRVCVWEGGEGVCVGGEVMVCEVMVCVWGGGEEVMAVSDPQ